MKISNIIKLLLLTSILPSFSQLNTEQNDTENNISLNNSTKLILQNKIVKKVLQK